MGHADVHEHEVVGGAKSRERGLRKRQGLASVLRPIGRGPELFQVFEGEQGVDLVVLGEKDARRLGALARPPGRAVIPADEIDEIRIVASWVAENEPAVLTLDPAPGVDELLAFTGAATPVAA
jgi:hypothetical protein